MMEPKELEDYPKEILDNLYSELSLILERRAELKYEVTQLSERATNLTSMILMQGGEIQSINKGM